MKPLHFMKNIFTETKDNTKTPNEIKRIKQYAEWSESVIYVGITLIVLSGFIDGSFVIFGSMIAFPFIFITTPFIYRALPYISKKKRTSAIIVLIIPAIISIYMILAVASVSINMI